MNEPERIPLSGYLASLFAHVGWADERVLESLREAKRAVDAELEILAHILGAEHVWLARLQENPAAVAVWPKLTIAECATLAEENQAAYGSFLSMLTAGDLDKVVHYRNSAGVEFDSRVEDILLHVALHGAYHRGQVALALRRGGSTPIPTDYIAFVRGAPAATRESSGIPSRDSGFGECVPVLQVKNARLSCEFYCGTLGFTKEWEHQYEPGFPLFVSVKRGKTALFLTEHPESVMGALIYIRVDSVDDVYGGLLGRGVTVDLGPVDQPWGTREMQLRDPDGNRLRLGQPTQSV